MEGSKSGGSLHYIGLGNTLIQLNWGESRHSLAREIFHGKRGELRQRNVQITC